MLEELDLKILKSIVNDKINALQFVYKYESDIFDEEAQRFAKLVIDYTKHFRAPPTRNTLLDRHKGNTTILEVINSVWDEIDQTEYDIKEFPYDVASLKKRAQLREVEKLREQAASDDPDNPQEPEQYFNNLSLAIARVTSLDLERTHTQKPVGDYIEEFQEKYEVRKINPESTNEIKTGYSLIDTLAPLRPSQLVIIGAESSAGKSMMLNNIGKQIWTQTNTIDMGPNDFVKGHNVLYFSLEMSYHDCFIRFLASLANVPQRALDRSSLTYEQEQRVKKAYKFIKEYQDYGCYFDIVDVPRNLTIEEIELRYHDALLRYRPDVVVVDYMGLMNSSSLTNEPDWLKLGGIASGLHEFGRAYDALMLTAAQLTDIKRNAQGPQDENRSVGMHRWGRSSLIMHNVNKAIQIETRNNEKQLPDLKYHLVKNREGPLGQGNLIKNFANASLIDVPYDQNELPGDVSANIPDLIRSIQEAKNKKNET